MLEISHISKQYKTGTLIQQALDDVSLNLRDNEFVAILGPSGSGKTTLLNIIGGLDRYDSGDLIINGISTKKYKDRDWDSYRNHTIGFVFQSYNLIPHQTVLANVELALTISGISGTERRQRAEEALKKVGLGNQMHKKPSQMSGGQMQRVAIARALVNNPDILLADEPTGALDTDTSIQVMDLLKEVAKDRLVVMVTHNPELAEQYATRIVKLRDGKILSDTRPYDPMQTEEPIHKNMGKSSMSFLTALSLSFNNLNTKKARTILVSFAGSIGIIGIALILSLSNGVNDYIADVEEETLSEYPVEITSSSYSMTSMLSDKDTTTIRDDEIHEISMVSNMLSTVTSNDLESLKKYIDSGESELETYSNAIEYNYNITPLIYRLDDDDSYRQVNPDTSLSSVGLGSSSSSNSLMSSMMSTNQFFALPEKSSLYQNEYTLEAGHWPENSHQLVLVLSSNGNVSDFLLYMLGVKDSKELDEMVDAFSKNDSAEIEKKESSMTYSAEDFLGITFKMVEKADLYEYDDEYKVWKDKSEDHKYVLNLIQNGTDLEIVGVVKPSEDTTASMLTSGIYYSYDLYQEIMDYSSSTKIVKDQLANKSINVFTGKEFGKDEDSELDLSKLITIDENALANAFTFDTSSLSMNLDLSSIDLGKSFDMSTMLSKVKINVTTDQVTKLIEQLWSGYETFEEAHPDSSLNLFVASFRNYLSSEEANKILAEDFMQIYRDSIQGKISTEDIQNIILETVQYYQNNFADKYPTIEEFLNSEEGQTYLTGQLAKIIEKISSAEISSDQIQKVLTDLYAGYENYAKQNGAIDTNAVLEGFSTYLESDSAQKLIASSATSWLDTSDVEKEMASQMSTLTTTLSSSITQAIQQSMQSMMSSMSVDAGAISNAFQFNSNKEELSELLTAMMYSSASRESYDSNLSTLNYAEEKSPSSISIYPKDFESKQSILDILDAYSQKMKDSNQEEKAIVYTDLVGTLMSSVTTIINAISYVLIAFVAISLVVSSIMIGVITFISVLERKKEIGILRAIGASKKNISSVFNAETFIIGLLAGGMGVGITLLLLIPINSIIHSLTGRPISGSLPISSAIILILLSIILTLIGGLIPSKKAAKSDPVEALRTE